MEKKFYRIPLGVTNCYLLLCKEGYLLIDTCYANTYEKFLQKLKALGLDAGEIRYLLLTHHHEDHAGFAVRLAEETGCRIIAHKKALQHLENGRTNNSMKPLNCRTKAAFSLSRIIRPENGYPPVNLSERDFIITGDNSILLKEIGISGEILETPGHCSDSISVLLEDGSLFAGDAAMNFLKPCGLRYRPIYSENIEEVYQSWTKVRTKGAKTVYPAHGMSFSVDLLK